MVFLHILHWIALISGIPLAAFGAFSISCIFWHCPFCRKMIKRLTDGESDKEERAMLIAHEAEVITRRLR